MKNLVILGSSRKESDTREAVTLNIPFEDYQTIDLLKYHIEHYRYDHNYSERDQMTRIVEQLVLADNIIFATPVYWYSMSSLMKVFFDRLTDLVTVKKEVGRLLKGKSTYLIASGGEDSLPEGFEVPFIRTSNYFNMKFVKSYYQKK